VQLQQLLQLHSVQGSSGEHTGYAAQPALVYIAVLRLQLLSVSQQMRPMWLGPLCEQGRDMCECRGVCCRHMVVDTAV
jgi:hypothetical protein